MRIRDAVTHLILRQPFYGYIAASLVFTVSGDIPETGVSFNPSPRFIYNKAWFEGLPGDIALGAVMHELLHLVLLHPFRRSGRELHLWTIACDMAVNEHIDGNMLPEDSVTVEKIAEEIKEKLPRYKSAETYYDIISRGEAQLGLLGNSSIIKVALRTGQELKANIPVEEKTSEIYSKAARSIISELVDQAKSEGEIPGGICGFISELYGSGEIDWRNVVKRFLTGRGKTLARKTFLKESKRFDGLPGKKRSVGLQALLAVDESGSISNKHMAMFFNELLRIRKITGADLSVTSFDTECTQPVPLKAYIKSKERVKSGGTDFRPVFQLADSMRIPLVIIFTDGDGTVPDHVNQKVLWVLTDPAKKPASFGHCITFGG